MISFIIFLTFVIVSFAAPAAVPAVIDPRQPPSFYAPVEAVCPAGSLVRPATSISTAEAAYYASRKAKADIGLKAWLAKTSSSFKTNCKLPSVALTTSGGGLRSLLTGAGVIQGFDSRDSQVGVSGVFQGLTYQAALSGGGWLLSSFAGNNYPTISSLENDLWKPAFQDTLLVPGASPAAGVDIALIVNDILAKQAAGFPPTLTDPYGRLLSYQLLYGLDGGVATRLSSITGFSNFTTHNVPYPIITALGVKTFQGDCLPGPNATQYEFHPFEFGSWDAGVKAFTRTAYLGSPLANGVSSTGTCIMNYDNLGYVLGTTSSLFNEICVVAPNNITTNPLTSALAPILEEAHALSTRDEYAVYPNPFYKYPRSTLVSAQKELDLVDGGEALQNNPIWPLIHPQRPVDVIIVNDNSADTNANYPNGSEILTTYVQAKSAGLTRMPYIPPVATFIAQGLNVRPTFFGCNDNSKITIVYLPNTNYTFASGTSTFQLEYPEAETAAMIMNGNQVANKGGDPMWPTCLGCAIMKKTGAALPGACTSCFSKYCYSQG
jgi:lysophospholipase